MSAAGVHPSRSELYQFASGGVYSIRAAVIEGHLENCAQCSGVVASAPEDQFVRELQTAGTTRLTDLLRLLERPAAPPQSEVDRPRTAGIGERLLRPAYLLPLITLAASVIWVTLG